jgi:hypothetical protein
MKSNFYRLFIYNMIQGPQLRVDESITVDNVSTSSKIRSEILEQRIRVQDSDLIGDMCCLI